jgi:hypothetical protein
VSILARYGIQKVVLHVRDPRAAIVSWTHHMERIMESRGLKGVELSCEMPMPDAYADWGFDERLRWQVDNKMPGFVRWIEDWLHLADTSRDIQFLVTDYSDLNKDARGLVKRILDFYDINYDNAWVSMPVVRVGKNNVFTLPDRPLPAGQAAMPKWAAAMSAETLQAANAMVPAPLIGRFGWDQMEKACPAEATGAEMPR